MLKELDSYDWKEAFGYAGEPGTEACRVSRGETGPVPKGMSTLPGATVSTAPFTREDVVIILCMSEGENDGPPWVIAGALRDGRWFHLSAGCDYTGWD